MEISIPFSIVLEIVFYFKLYGASIMYDLREKEKMQRIFLDQTNNILKHHKCLKRVNFYSTVD